MTDYNFTKRTEMPGTDRAFYDLEFQSSRDSVCVEGKEIVIQARIQLNQQKPGGNFLAITSKSNPDASMQLWAPECVGGLFALSEQAFLDRIPSWTVDRERKFLAFDLQQPKNQSLNVKAEIVQHDQIELVRIHYTLTAGDVLPDDRMVSLCPCLQHSGKEFHGEGSEFQQRIYVPVANGLSSLADISNGNLLSVIPLPGKKFHTTNGWGSTSQKDVAGKLHLIEASRPVIYVIGKSYDANNGGWMSVNTIGHAFNLKSNALDYQLCTHADAVVKFERPGSVIEFIQTVLLLNGTLQKASCLIDTLCTANKAAQATSSS